MSRTEDETLRDQDALQTWLASAIDDFKGPCTLSRLSGGQSNPTWRVDTATGQYVVRCKPAGETVASAHAIDREYRVIRALGPTVVPVPEPVGYCDDPAVFGSEFYVMRYLEGRIHWDPRLPSMSPEERSRVFDAMNAVIAAIHTVDVAAVGLDDYGRHGAYLQRQISRWSAQYRQSATSPNPAMDNLIDWLPDHAPQDDLTRLVHGDYRLDNLVLHPEEPRVIGVLDWELSTLGSPIADFAYHMVTWRFPPDLFRGLAGTDLATAGIPDEANYVDAYFRRTGFDRPEDWEFYMVLNMFRIAAILQGIARRSIDGTASDPGAAELGAKAVPISRLAWDTARRIG